MLVLYDLVAVVYIVSSVVSIVLAVFAILFSRRVENQTENIKFFKIERCDV